MTDAIFAINKEEGECIASAPDSHSLTKKLVDMDYDEMNTVIVGQDGLEDVRRRSSRYSVFNALFAIGCGVSALWLSATIFGASLTGSTINQQYTSFGIPEMLLLIGVLFFVISYLVKPKSQN